MSDFNFSCSDFWALPYGNDQAWKELFMGYTNGMRGPQNIMNIQRVVQKEFSIKRGKYVKLQIRKLPKGNKRADKRFQKDWSLTFEVTALCDYERAAQEAVADAIARLEDLKNECERKWDLSMSDAVKPRSTTVTRQCAPQPAKVADIGMPELTPPTPRSPVKQPKVAYKPFVPRLTRTTMQRAADNKAARILEKQAARAEKRAAVWLDEKSKADATWYRQKVKDIRAGKTSGEDALKQAGLGKKRGQTVPGTVQREKQTVRTEPTGSKICPKGTSLDSRARAFEDAKVKRAQNEQRERHYYRKEIEDICGECLSDCVKQMKKTWARQHRSLHLGQLEELYQMVCDTYDWNPTWYNGHGPSIRGVTKKVRSVVTKKVAPLPAPMQAFKAGTVWENPTFSKIPTVEFPKTIVGCYSAESLPLGPGLQRSKSQTSQTA